MKRKIDLGSLSNFVIAYCNENAIPINHLKLQKILYYIQAWHLVYFDKENLFDERPQAWVNGPVYRSVYERFKNAGVYPNIELREVNLEDAKRELALEDNQYEFLNAIMNHYGIMPHEKLVYLTHKEKPWNEAREGLKPFDYSEKEISLDSMFDFYSERRKKK